MAEDSVLDELLADARERMQKSVEACRHELATVRTGRASPHLLDRITVDYYGADTPLNQLANVTASDARLLTLTPYDKNSIPLLEKAIRESDLGVNPSNDGKVLRCVFPELTEERRKEYIKVARSKAEEGRVAVRNIRRTAKQTLDRAEKDGEVGQDDVTGAEKKLDSMTKKHTDEIDDMLKKKEAELLEV